MHQHRAVYELYDQQEKTDAVRTLHDDIHAYDRRVLSRSQRRFANSRRVAARLSHYNQLDSETLYHPLLLLNVFSVQKPPPTFFILAVWKP